MKKKRISVIIPCYNYGSFLEECVKSVLNQTFSDYEIIIVDDGSTDIQTQKLLEKIQQEYPDIRVIHQPNGHLSNARNNGIRIAKGDFFLPLDADDTIEPTMLEKCFKEITKNESLGMVYTYIHFFGDIEKISKNQDYNFYDLLFANHLTVCSLVRKKAWEEAGGFDEKMKDGYEDWEFWINIGKRGWYGKMIPEPLFNYRKHGQTMINKSELKHYSIIKYIRKKHADVYAKDSLKNLKKIWKSRGNGRLFDHFREKIEGAGLDNPEFWRKHPCQALGRCVPIRIKRKMNSLLQKNFFDTSYYKR